MSDPEVQPRVVDVDCQLCGKVVTHERRSDGSLECVSCRVKLRMEAERAAASGVAMRFCPVCGGGTPHDATGCARCRQAHAIARATSSQRASHRTRNIVFGVGSALAILCSGFFHCTYGGVHGFDMVQKEEWGYYDQFVDMEGIEGQPLITLLGRARTVRALIRGGAISIPSDR